MSVLGPGPVKTHFDATVKERYTELTAKVGNSSVYEKYYAKRMQDAKEMHVTLFQQALLSKECLWLSD